MSDVFIGQVLMFPFGFAPNGFALCSGQLLPIAGNTALFSLLGTQYGGNGQTTFALPNLNGNVPLGFGQGPGLSNYDQGQVGGSDVVALAVTDMPSHNHAIDISSLTAIAKCSTGAANRQTPVGNVPAAEAATGAPTYSDGVPDANMMAGAIALSGTLTAASAGGGQSHSNLQPYLGMNYCIALTGVFPSRP
jgi:microcystin-dependent protein